MKTLIYKTELSVERAPSWLAPNTPVELRAEADHPVAAYVQRPQRWTSLFGAAKPVRIGTLNEDAGYLLRPAFEAGNALRTRIVELQPAHLAKDRRARISVSVWAGVARAMGHPVGANSEGPK